MIGERGAYRLARPLSSIQVPSTVQAILASRIDRLSPEDKELLQAASVIGKDVPYTLLAAIAGESEEGLRRELGHLQTAEFLYEVGSLPDLQYTFRHALTHEVAYAGLLHERRRSLHGRVVEAIERLDAERLTTQVDRLAHHAFRGEIWDKALAYCQEAGARGFARSAHAEALDRVDQALHALHQLGEPARNTLSELLLVAQRAAALRALRGYAAAEVEEVYRQARELCRAVGDTPERFSIEWQQMQFFLVRGDLDAAAELSTRLLGHAERSQDRSELMDAHLATGMTLFHQGRFAAARDHLERGVALYRPEDDKPHLVTHGQDPGAFCLSYLAYTLWFLGYPDQASARAEMALDVARRSAHAFSHVSALTFVARVSQCRRDLDADPGRGPRAGGGVPRARVRVLRSAGAHPARVDARHGGRRRGGVRADSRRVRGAREDGHRARPPRRAGAARRSLPARGARPARRGRCWTRRAIRRGEEAPSAGMRSSRGCGRSWPVRRPGPARRRSAGTKRRCARPASRARDRSSSGRP